MFLKVFHDKFAQTDVSKEMWVPNAKGLKHLNTVIKGQCCYSKMFAESEFVVPNNLELKTEQPGSKS